ncbi:hypothetical protein D7S86_27430 [Pararobbsia silviterrae]|uniref:Uncharacterized protein n=1 Tax=Pararobbsia silviterrae TaxID=1792498 RepID=A0A494XB03_9BURK|nr:hypothetical protein D7S86_27430 [Pararobbsia silviterrae]
MSASKGAPRQLTGRGGAGRGQGRKAIDAAGKLHRKSVTLDEQSIATLRAFGDGDLSVGIRRAATAIRPAEE